MERAPRPSRHVRRVAVAALALAAVTAGLTAQHFTSATADDEVSVNQPGTSDSSAPETDDAPCRITFGAVGSSHTDGGYPISGMVSDDGDEERGTFLDASTMVPTSWAYHAARDRYVHLDGGWALGGSTVEELANKIEPWMFSDDSYAVLFVGTVDNLPKVMVPPEESMSHLDRLVENTGIPHDRILLVNLPPIRHLEQRAIDYNNLLDDYAEGHDIRLFDLHSMVSNGFNWRPGYDADGVHFSRDVAALVGQGITNELSAMSGCVVTEFDAVAQEQGLGEPTGLIMDSLPEGGKTREFAEGSVYSSNLTPPVAVTGRVRDAWLETGGATGPHSYPMSPEHCTEGACTQVFLGGEISIDEATGVVAHRMWS